jgi:hypothetical protein
MKHNKALLTVLTMAILWPSFAFAAWWNPFTWFTKTQKVEPVEVRQEVGTTSKEVENPVVAVPSVSVSTTTNKAPEKAVVKPEQPKEDLEKIRLQKEAEEQLRAVQEKVEAQLRADALAEQARQERIEAIKTQQAIDRANEEATYEQARRNSAVNAYNEQVEEFDDRVGLIKQKMLDLRKEYLDERDRLYTSGSLSGDQANAWVNELTRRYQSNYARLELEYEELLLNAPTFE